MARIGLIAGKGQLPVIWAKAARKKGIQIYAFPLIEEADNPLEDIVAEINYVNIGALQTLLEKIKEYQITSVVMIGKVEKARLFQDISLDQKMQKLLAGLKQLNDDAIMMAVVQELINNGIEVIKQSTYLDGLLPKAGVLTEGQPDSQLLADMKFGFRMAREIGRLDIGQTVVVKNRAVLAVEAIEGTDQAIKRGGQYGGTGVVVAKVSKPQQDLRFDIPTIGPDTLKILRDIQAKGLVVEAGKTFLINKEELITEADQAGIVLMALDEIT